MIERFEQGTRSFADWILAHVGPAKLDPFLRHWAEKISLSEQVILHRANHAPARHADARSIRRFPHNGGGRKWKLSLVSDGN